ncbi:acetyl-CoA carboxylase biotin carboxyl carrier protein subunit [Bacteroidota bacterium]
MKLKRSSKPYNSSLKYYACFDNNRKYELSFKQNKGAKINGHTADIGIQQEEDGFIYLIWKNKKYYAEIIDKNQNSYVVLINGISYKLSIETPISYKRKKYLEKNAANIKTQSISAPMPGKIIEVLTEENDVIQQGDPLFILEAMKMQNEILSHVSGKITKINVKQNDSVVKGDVLVEIE